MGRVVMAPKDVLGVEMVDWYFNGQDFEILSQYARARQKTQSE